MANVPQQEVFVNTLNFLNSFMARHIIFCLLSVKQFFFSSWPLLKLLTDWNLKFQDTFYLNVPIKPCLSPWYAKRNVFIWLMMESDFEIFDNVWSFMYTYVHTWSFLWFVFSTEDLSGPTIWACIQMLFVTNLTSMILELWW